MIMCESDMGNTESATGGVLYKKMFLKISINLQENTCARVSFLIKLLACNFIKRETLAQVFSCEFWEISKNTLFTKHLWTTASVWGDDISIVMVFGSVKIPSFLASISSLLCGILLKLVSL